MKAQILAGTYNVSANCPICRAVTSFESKTSISLNNRNYWGNGTLYGRLLYVLSQCAGCGLGASRPYMTTGTRMARFWKISTLSQLTRRIFLRVFPVTYRPSSAKRNGARD